MDGTGDQHTKKNKPDSVRQILHVFSPMWNLALKRNKHLSRKGREKGPVGGGEERAIPTTL
jgi:hypothetical protein